MNKRELIDTIQEKMTKGEPKAVYDKMITEFAPEIIEAVRDGAGKVQVKQLLNAFVLEVVKVAHKGASKDTIDSFIDNFVLTVEEAVMNGNEVFLKGFGKFDRKIAKGREGTSSLSGEVKAWKTEDSYRFNFKPSAPLAEKIKNIEIVKE